MSGDITGGRGRASADAVRADADVEATTAPVLRGIADGAAGTPLDAVPPRLRGAARPTAEAAAGRPALLEVLARMNDPPARGDAARAWSPTRRRPDAERLKAIDLLAPGPRPAVGGTVPRTTRDGEVGRAAESACSAGSKAFDDPTIGETVLAAYPSYSPAVKKRAVQTAARAAGVGAGAVQARRRGQVPEGGRHRRPRPRRGRARTTRT